MPAVRRAGRVGRRAGDADDERRDRDDAVVGAQHAGAQPVEPLPDTAGVRLSGVRGVVGGHSSQ